MLLIFAQEAIAFTLRIRTIALLTLHTPIYREPPTGLVEYWSGHERTISNCPSGDRVFDFHKGQILLNFGATGAFAVFVN